MPSKKRPTRKPATSVEGREGQLVSLAIDLAEKQMQDGTASSQVISNFLKLGTVRESLEREKLTRENKLLEAKVENMVSGKKVEELYDKAIQAMKHYSGQSDHGVFDD